MSLLKCSFGLVLTLYGALVAATPLCDETQRVEISKSNLSSADGRLLFNEGTYWYHEDGTTYGCPCLIKNCLKPCKGQYVHSDLDEKTHAILHGEKENVRVHEHFHVLNPVNESIEGSLFCFDIENEVEFKLLKNGSIILIGSEMIRNIDQFCLGSENGTMYAVVCEFPMDHQSTTSAKVEYSSLLYPILGCISCAFLFLVVALYFLIPEMRTLQNKSVIFQSATLAFALVALSVLHLSSSLLKHPNACKFFAHVSQYFLLSSFAWLSTMCFDMFWTFSALKNMAAMSQSSGNLKFKVYGVIATVFPLVPLCMTVILDLALTEQSQLWPGISFKNCWFHSRLSEFWFFQGPLLIMLLSNVGFSVATLAHICKSRNELKILNAQDNRTHNNRENWRHLWLTLKLFTLMGGTWLMEFVSWALETHGILSTICDAINILRGPIIFYLCVVGNAKVRKAILSRLRPKVNRASRTSQSTTHSDFASGAATSLTMNANSAL